MSGELKKETWLDRLDENLLREKLQEMRNSCKIIGKICLGRW